MNDMPLTTLDAALSLAAQSIPVFPCAGDPRSKKRKQPLTRNGFKDASTDPDTIRAWWDEHPNALIGMPTGKASGIVVLDLDKKNGKDGFAAVPDWETLSQTQVRTTSGGGHIYFAADSYVPCSTGKDGVDVRGDGGYVIVPPSPGWAFTSGGFDTIGDLPPFPDKFRRREARLQPMGTPGNNPHAPIAALEAAMQVIPIGPDEYDWWVKIGMALHRATKGSSDGFRLWDAWSQRGAKYDGTTSEKWDTWEGRPPKSIGAGTIFYEADKADPSWRERADTADPGWQQRAFVEGAELTLGRLTEFFFSSDHGMAVASRIETYFATAVGPAVQLETKSLADFEGQTAPPRKWIVEGLIPDRNVTDLSGDGGTGKSILALQVGIAMATKTNWLGFPVVPGRVLYMSCEDEMDEMRRRTEALCRHGGIGLGHLRDLHVADMTLADSTELAAAEKGRLTLTPLLAALEAKIAELRPKLVILDTRADVFAGDEVNRTQVRVFVKALRRLCFQYDLAVLMLSHPSLTGMNSGSGQSGSTAWGNSVRSRLYLDRPRVNGDVIVDPDLRVLSTKKANYGAADTEVTLRWVSGEFVAQRGSAGIDQQARAGMAKERFMELLDKFERRGKHVNDTGLNYAPKLFAEEDQTIGIAHFRNAMGELYREGRIRKVPRGPASRGMSMLVKVQQ